MRGLFRGVVLRIENRSVVAQLNRAALGSVAEDDKPRIVQGGDKDGDFWFGGLIRGGRRRGEKCGGYREDEGGGYNSQTGS